jgi:CTP:molybdopterin cytidylyltransferase MocA
VNPGIVKPALVLLAAGSSSRLGACKALVSLTPKNAPKNALELLSEAGACFDGATPLVITGADHARIEAALPRGLEIAHNAEWSRGRTGGVALAHLRRPGLDLCLAPVDVPLVPARVFEALLWAWASAGSPSQGWLAPRRAGRFGHPVLVGRSLLEELAEFEPGAPLSALRARADPLLSVDVDADEVLDDLDDPEDLARMRGRTGG